MRHDDRLLADRVVADGRPITDEQGMSSRRWHHVSIPATEVSGWLPGVRVRNAPEVPYCRTSGGAPLSPDAGTVMPSR